MSMLLRYWKYALGVALSTLAALAQTTGAIEGTVYDPSGAVVPGANVRLISSETGAERNLRGDAAGLYLAPSLPPGTYEVQVSASGLRPAIRRQVGVDSGRSAKVDFHLEIGEARDALEVPGTAPLISMSASDWGATVDRGKLESLPLNGRDLFTLTALEPGVKVATTVDPGMTTGLGEQYSVNGARPNQNSFRMDGVYVNDASYSVPTSAGGRTLGVEGIQEIRVLTSQFSAEYGQAAGAVFTAVSRSGTNTVHGSLYSFFRNNATDARNYFDSPSEPPPPLHRYQFGGAIGGPVRSDKLFYFLNYEGNRADSSETERPVTLTAEARLGRLPRETIAVAESVTPYLDLFPLPNGTDFGDGTAEYVSQLDSAVREDYVAGKIDFVPSSRWRLAGRYTFDDSSTAQPDPFHIWNLGSGGRYQFVHTDAQFIASPATIHNLRVGFSRVNNIETADVTADVPASLSFIEGEPLGAIRVTGLAELGGLAVRQRPRNFRVQDVQWNYDATLIRGRHCVRLGAAYDLFRFFQLADVNRIGYYRFDSVRDFLTATAKTGELMKPGTGSARTWTQHRYSVFGQDELRLNSHVTLLSGVRYEGYTVPTEKDGKVATVPDPLHDRGVTVGGPLFDNPSAANFAPRVSLALDPFGSGRTVVRAGAGIFFDLLGTRDLVTAGQRVPPFFVRLAIPYAPFPDLLAAADAGTADATIDGLDYHLRQPYVEQYQLAVQQRIGDSTVAEIGYAGSRGAHLMGMIGNVNMTRPIVQPDGRLFFPRNGQLLNPALGRVGLRRTQFNSFYHGLRTSLERRWARGLHIQANYSFSKAIDETSQSATSQYLGGDSFPNIFDYRSNRGLASFDLRHAAAMSFSYALPARFRTAWNALAGGWEVSGLAQIQSGQPFSPSVGFDNARVNTVGTDGGQRPNLARPGAQIILGDPQRYFDATAFSLPEAGYFGNLGRNTLIGPGLAALNAAVQKNIWTRERQTLRLRIEAFNVTNHPNFQVPVEPELFNRQGQVLASAARLSKTTTTARQIQFAVKWVF